MKWGTLEEQPTPDTTTVLLGSTFISARAIWTALRIPKSPQPGHQSLCTVVFRSVNLSASFQHQPFRSLSVRDQPDGAVHFLAGHRPAVVLDDELLDRDAGPLSEDPNQLSGVVHLDPDDGLGPGEQVLDVLGRERIDEPDLEEVDLHAVFLQPPHRVEY